MNRLIQKAGLGIASAAILASVWAPAAFAESGTAISGNGAGSHNTIKLNAQSNCDVYQTSNTNVEAYISATANTGGNEASSNTNGNVTIDTGKATASANLTVKGGSNTANNPCCCVCNKEPSDPALISGNGSKSINVITDDTRKSSKIKQNANTTVGAVLSAKAKTGKNKANKNTGPGDVSITTGDAGSSATGSVSGGMH